ncbi:MAG: glycosyltransferase [Ignavibacteria bacterium]|nr:glycosyltransferase [Ignavibacteria bacterium]
MEIFFVLITIGFLLLHLYLYHGQSKSIALDNDLSDKLPFVSVIVAGRNEEKNIAACIDSLSKIHYPKDKLQIMLVNDKSTDNTLTLMLEATSGLNQFDVMTSRDIIHNNLRGKANAIDSAIEICKGEIIMMTDADCIVQPSWVLNTVKYFNKDVSMVCGFTLISSSNSLFAKLQCLDWIYLLTLASSSCGLDKIMSCIGNNLAFTKKAYDHVGGYRAIGFSVTEDLALMRKINEIKDSRIVYPVSFESLVMTEPCLTIKELSSQKRRWFRGGTGVNGLGYVTGFELYTASVLLILGYFFISFKLWIILSSLILLSMFLLMSRTALRLKTSQLFSLFPLFAAYLAVYGLLLPISFVFGRKIDWKGRKF